MFSIVVGTGILKFVWTNFISGKPKTVRKQKKEIKDLKKMLIDAAGIKEKINEEKENR